MRIYSREVTRSICTNIIIIGTYTGGSLSQVLNRKQIDFPVLVSFHNSLTVLNVCEKIYYRELNDFIG